jgi:diaminopimelate decarboxylase
MPMSAGFSARLLPMLEELVADYPTPFYVYDAAGITATYRAMVDAFGDQPYRQYFAVKALPNPHLLEMLLDEGSGLDCASPVELLTALRVGATGEDVVFTSNNTSRGEYELALHVGAVVTFDDRSFLDKVDVLPAPVAFRVAPHGLSSGSGLMGDPVRSKFGIPVDQIDEAYRAARCRGATRFGIHGMTCANELDLDRAVQAAVDVVEVAARVCAAAGIELEYVNVGGGLGVPYRPEDKPLDFALYADALVAALRRQFGSTPPRLLTELGRYVTGPHGVLVSRVVTRCRKGRDIIGLDASMSALMRPALYGAYHHVSLPFSTGRPELPFDVVGSLCENRDKFAEGRLLPEPEEGDIAILHDTGAHGHAMGFTYNGRLRPAELMLTGDGEVLEVRRAESFEDYLATVRRRPQPVLPGGRVGRPAANDDPGGRR